MIYSDRLPIYEEILLLALDDDKGTTGMGSMFCDYPSFRQSTFALSLVVQYETNNIHTDDHRDSPDVTVSRVASRA